MAITQASLIPAEQVLEPRVHGEEPAIFKAIEREEVGPFEDDP